MPAKKTVLNNSQVADMFTLIADLSEIKGENMYKTLAYRRAADNLKSLGGNVNDYWKEDRLEEIPGVGKAIAEKIDEILRTGKLEFLEKLKKEIPVGLVDWMEVPGLGPKKAALIWKQLNITTMPELEKAAREGKLQGLPGFGKKTEEQILTGIESLTRRSGRIPIGRAYPLSQQIIAALQKVPGVRAVDTAGSLRRMRSTVGDIDILASAEDSKPVMEAFTTLPNVVRVLGRGPTKASIEFGDGIRSQLWVHPPEHYGTALVYATGSKDHNVHLREVAKRKDQFARLNTAVLAVSSNPPDQNAASLRTRDLPFRLLSDDTSHTNARRFKSYDDFEELDLHSTIFVDREGRVRWARNGGAPFMELDFLLAEIGRLK